MSLAAPMVRAEELDGAPGYERILLASEGRPISDSTVDRVIELARESGATAHVFSIARVHGVGFGMQTPGLLPSKREWAEQHTD